MTQGGRRVSTSHFKYTFVLEMNGTSLYEFVAVEARKFLQNRTFLQFSPLFKQMDVNNQRMENSIE
jgi:hypothetical protein